MNIKPYNKKGIFFSILSIFILILFVSSFEIINNFEIGETEMEITRTRVEVLNSVINDMEKTYFDRLIYVASKNSLMGLSRYYSETNFDSTRLEKSLTLALDDVIDDGILNKFDNTKIDLKNYQGTSYINEEHTLDGLVSNISNIFSFIGVDLKEFDLKIISVEQKDRFKMEVKAEIEYFFKDKNNIAGWRGKIERTIDVTVYGLYGYDYEISSTVSNPQIITSRWRNDYGPISTEPSLVRKLGSTASFIRTDPGLGICSPDFNCNNDGSNSGGSGGGGSGSGSGGGGSGSGSGGGSGGSGGSGEEEPENPLCGDDC